MSCLFQLKQQYRFYYTLICMNRLYSIAFKRILTALNSQEINPSNVDAVLDSNKIKPIGSFVFHRLARQQLRNFIKTPCPVQNVEGDQNKAIIKSSKALRASFTIEQEKVCFRCPHQKNCPEKSKPGQQNNLNAFSDLLVFMQGMNNNSTLQVKTQKRVWVSGYKACDSILATIEDLKKQAPQSLEYERIRLQYVTEKEQKQGQSVENVALEKDKKKKKKDSNKKQSQINDLNEKQSRSKIKVSPKKILSKIQEEDDIRILEQENIGQQQSYKNQMKRQRRQNNKMHRLNKSTIPPNNFDLRKKKLEYFQRPQPRENRQRSYDRRRDDSNGYQNFNKQRSFDKRRDDSSGYQNFNRQRKNQRQDNYNNQRRTSNYKEQREERRPQRQREQSGYNEYRQNRSTEPRQSREKILYNQRKTHKKQIEKQQVRDIDFNDKFESAGKIYKRQKVFQPWGQNQTPLRNEKPYKMQKQKTQINPQQKIERQFKSESMERSDVEGEKKRGRRIKK